MKSVMQIAALVVFCLALSSLAVPQQKTTTNDPKTGQVQTLAPTTAPKPPLVFGLPEDTPVRIRFSQDHVLQGCKG